jgi:hypothetical protein
LNWVNVTKFSRIIDLWACAVHGALSRSFGHLKFGVCYSVLLARNLPVRAMSKRGALSTKC